MTERDRGIAEGEQDTILILDFGAQYTQLIARRIRECKVFSEIVPSDITAQEVAARRPRGIIFSGGPSSVFAENAPSADSKIYDLGIPILGICYGQQLMAKDLGGDVQPASQREYGPATLHVRASGELLNGLAGINSSLDCWMSHGDKVLTPPAGFTVLATTPQTPVAAMECAKRRFYGVQFHPEVEHTPFGTAMLGNFVHNVCGCSSEWTSAGIIDRAVAEIRSVVGDGKVVCGVSGGVDSCCVAALVHKAIGDRLTCIFVDHGLLRKGEPDQVRQDFAAAFGINLVFADASERFLTKLKGVSDPEKKRKIIGREFINVFQQHAESITGVQFLAQGTLYPDVIESGGSKHAQVIKSHHNVGGLPKRMKLKVVEPLKRLFKDEVRAISSELGLPDSIVWRHPFPGPGLGIRILGSVTRERLDLLREADSIFMQELQTSGLYRSMSQALAVLPLVKSVGVMGDQRTYAHPIILRAVTTEDYMTARWAHLPYEFLERVSARIVNEVNGVNRVVYDISSKPPATIEWE